ncbi:hypothetical protein HX13_17960 [Chryseobacterium sp. P1-3]|nr:hypothetical protein HX13_17960 [Chryseobacterium sp. P1-3]
MAIDLYKATTKSLVGNKAFNLMKVAKAGIAVPPGFVVNSAENLSDKKTYKNCMINLYLMEKLQLGQALIKKMEKRNQQQVFIKHC